MSPNDPDQSPNASSTSTPTGGRNPTPHGDEISLIDLWSVLVHRKWFIVITAAAVVFLGLSYAMLKTPVFGFQTIVHTAQGPDGGSIVSGERQEELFNEVLIPAARNALENGDPDTRAPTARARALETSDIVRLTSSAAEAQADRVNELHSRVVAKVQAEFSDKVERARDGLEDRIQRQRLEQQERMEQLRSGLRGKRMEVARHELAYEERRQQLDTSLRAKQQDLAARELRFEEQQMHLQASIRSKELEHNGHELRMALLEEQDSLLEEQIHAVQHLEARLQNGEMTPDEPWAMALAAEPMTSLLNMRRQTERDRVIEVPTQIHQIRQARTQAEFRLETLESERERAARSHEQAVARINAELEDLQTERGRAERRFEQTLARLEDEKTDLQTEIEREQQRHELQLATLNRQLENIRDTEARGPVALMSRSPEGQGKSLIAALAIILGLMLGVFGAFFREFLASVRATEAH